MCVVEVESIDELYEVAGLESMTKEQYRGFYNANMKDFKYEGGMEELALRLDVYEAFKHKGMCPRCKQNHSNHLYSNNTTIH